ncbi:MAG TPA: COX15/CtaA family protein [Nitrososphaeraceae archaeon]
MISGRSITASRQGISCTEWPLCPNGFALPSAKLLYENIHRLLAIVSAISISTITIILRKDQSKHTRVSYLALIFILFEIFIGMFVVFTKLQSIVVAIHLSNGVIVFALTILLLVSYRDVIRRHS